MNRKILFGGIAAVMIAAIAAVSVSRNSNESAMNDVTLSGIEALGAEWGGWANFWEGQGFYRDEREVRVGCQGGSSYSVSYSYGGHTVTYTYNNGQGAEKIECAYGDTNCASTNC